MNSRSDNYSARYAAQRLAFAPLMFQACRVLRDVGLLEALSKARARGLTVAEALEGSLLSRYAAELLFEAGLASGLCTCSDVESEPRFFITNMGVYWLRDPLTRVNTDFVHYVCYEGAFQLQQALLEGLPAGLPAIDATGAATVYQALKTLSPEVRKAWFDFDNYYSDGVFEACIPWVLDGGQRIVDIGVNTGRFARMLLEKSDVHVTLVDLPGQLALAEANLQEFVGRFTPRPTDLLDPEAPLPEGGDVYWMSQFLDCFGEDEVVSILSRVRRAMKPTARVLILETFWDQQQHEAARFCVIGTSLYFACIANGNSRMYHSAVMRRLIGESGLEVVNERHQIGLSHSLLECRRLT